MATPELDSGAPNRIHKPGNNPGATNSGATFANAHTLPNAAALRTMAGGSKRADGKRLKKATAAAEQGRKRLRPDSGMAGSSVAAGTEQERRLAEECPAPSEAVAADQEPQRREMAGASEESRGPNERPLHGRAEAGAEQWHTPRGEFSVGEGVVEKGVVDNDTGDCNEDPFLLDVLGSPAAQGLGGTVERFGPAFGDPVAPAQSELQAEGAPETSLAISGGGDASVSTRRVRRRLGTADLGPSLTEGCTGATVQGAEGGNKGRGKGGRRPSTKSGGHAPRWCKLLYVHDPKKEGVLLRGSAKSGLQADHHKILCRLCGHMISFAASSFTTAAKHAGVHGVTRDNLDVAVALADKADENGELFPLKDWQTQLAEAEGTRRVFSYMRQAPYETGSPMWQETRAAIARWIATDSLPMTVVETAAFRAFCRTLNGRCPAFSRKAISKKVSS